MKALPHLGTTNWITDPSQLMLKLYEYYLISDKSQSNIFTNHIASLKQTIQKYSDLTEIKDIIKEELSAMYGRYFDSVVVNVTDNYDDNKANVLLEISIKVTKDGKEYFLNREIQNSDNNIENLDDRLSEIYA